MNADGEFSFHPVDLTRQSDNSILLRWNDGQLDVWTAAKLREVCPCATCREKQRAKEEKKQEAKSAMLLPVLSQAEAAPLKIEAMEPIGGYAYRVRFSDGHGSGIYPFDLLRKSKAELETG